MACGDGDGLATMAVLIPAAGRDDVVDTVDSVARWMPDALVVVLNDSDRRLEPLRGRSRVVVLPPLPWRRNAYGGLWAKVCWGLRWILANSHASMVLRLDADAVVLRAGLEQAAAERFAADPALGLLGGYRMGPDGGSRDLEPARRALNRHAGFGGLRRPGARRELRAVLGPARRQGYSTGEHVIACASILRRSMVERWDRAGWLQPVGLARSRLADDFLMAVCARAAGYHLGEAGGPGDLVAVTWKGLPGPPAELLAGPAYVTHSVRGFGAMDEQAVRAAFAASRL